MIRVQMALALAAMALQGRMASGGWQVARWWMPGLFAAETVRFGTGRSGTGPDSGADAGAGRPLQAAGGRAGGLGGGRRARGGDRAGRRKAQP